MEKFAKRIKELRTDAHLSRVALADELGVTRYSITDWELGRSTPTLPMVIKIADFFEVTIDYLVGRKDYYL